MRALGLALLTAFMIGAGGIAQASPPLPDVVSTATRYESGRLGYGGAPSELHAAFWQFANATPTPALQTLLSHQNPVVRAYAAVYLLSERPAAAGLLLPLFQDNTRFATMESCMGGYKTPQELLMTYLHVHHGHRAVQDLLLTLIKAGRLPLSDVSRTLDYLGPYRTPEVMALLQALASHPDKESRRKAAGLLNSFAKFPTLMPLSKLAIALPWLGTLITDPIDDVRDLAILAADHMCQYRPDDVPALLQSPNPAVRRIAIYGLGAAARERRLPLLAEHFAKHPMDIPAFEARPFAVRETNDRDHVAFMRAMLSVPSPQRYLAIRSLRKHVDKESAAAIRNFLQSPIPQERLEAIRAAGVLHDAPAALQLLPLLRSALSEERLAAAQTLAELCLRQHVTALGTAAAQEPVATAPAMKQSLERLMTCRLEPAPMAPVWPALPR